MDRTLPHPAPHNPAPSHTPLPATTFHGPCPLDFARKDITCVCLCSLYAVHVTLYLQRFARTANNTLALCTRQQQQQQQRMARLRQREDARGPYRAHAAPARSAHAFTFTCCPEGKTRAAFACLPRMAFLPLCLCLTLRCAMPCMPCVDARDTLPDGPRTCQTAGILRIAETDVAARRNASRYRTTAEAHPMPGNVCATQTRHAPASIPATPTTPYHHLQVAAACSNHVDFWDIT